MMMMMMVMMILMMMSVQEAKYLYILFRRKIQSGKIMQFHQWYENISFTKDASEIQNLLPYIFIRLSGDTGNCVDNNHVNDNHGYGNYHNIDFLRKWKNKSGSFINCIIISSFWLFCQVQNSIHKFEIINSKDFQMILSC